MLAQAGVLIAIGGHQQRQPPCQRYFHLAAAQVGLDQRTSLPHRGLLHHDRVTQTAQLWRGLGLWWVGAPGR